jgi:carbon storage regulator
MLILSRKTGESIIIDGSIHVRVMRVDGEVVKLGIQAPAEVPVHRQEVYEEIQQSNQAALTKQRPALPRLPGATPRQARKLSQTPPATTAVGVGSLNATTTQTR